MSQWMAEENILDVLRAQNIQRNKEFLRHQQFVLHTVIPIILLPFEICSLADECYG